MDCDCLKLGRLEKVADWVKTPEGTWIATFFCDACGSKTDIVAHDDPANLNPRIEDRPDFR